MRVALVNSLRRYGGAANLTQTLRGGLSERGHEVTLFHRNGVETASGSHEPYDRAWPRSPWLRGALRLLKRPRVLLERLRGHHDFEFDHVVAQLSTRGPFDVVHLHNLHGDYFDLRALRHLAERQPTVLTVHDLWLLTGRCCQPLSCERWRTGCCDCPSPGTYLGFWRDGPEHNWRRKFEILNGANLWVVAPSKWALAKVAESPMFRGRESCRRHIPNGVDVRGLRPLPQAQARRSLGLPIEGFYLGMAARFLVRDRLKNFALAREAAALAAARVRRGSGPPLRVLVYGAAQSELPAGDSPRYVATPRPQAVADFYGSLDVFLHSSKAETSSLVVMEAMASGRPCVVNHLESLSELVTHGSDGFLTAPDSAELMAAALVRLLEDGEARERFGRNARQKAERSFSSGLMTDRYEDLYVELRAAWSGSLAGTR